MTQHFSLRGALLRLALCTGCSLCSLAVHASEPRVTWNIAGTTEGLWNISGGKTGWCNLLEAAVESCLTERQREVLRRHEYRGESFEQIADELHMQPPAVRMQLSRARKAIRLYFKEHRP